MAKLSIKKFKAALVDSMGNITTIAKVCNVGRSTVYRLLEKHPKLNKDIRDEENRITDVVENNLKLMAMKNNITAIKFYLETKAVDRGYGRKQELEVRSDGQLKIDLSEFEEYIGEGKESEHQNPKGNQKSNE